MTELRERIADIVKDALMRHGVSLSKIEGTLDDADAAIAAVMQDLEAPSEGMVEFAARAIITRNWPNMPPIDVDEMWDGQAGNAAAAIKAIAKYRKE